MPRIALCTLIVCLSAVSLSAQPDHVSWQGLLTDGDGNPLSGPVNLEFNFYSVPSGGESLLPTAIVKENVPLDNGVASVAIGPLPRTFRTHYLSLEFEKTLYLGLRVNGEPELPRSPVQAAPAALTLAVPAKLYGDRTDGSAVLLVENSGNGPGVKIYAQGQGIEAQSDGIGVYGSGNQAGVLAEIENNGFATVGRLAYRHPTTGQLSGAFGSTSAVDGIGVAGSSNAATGFGNGLRGTTASPEGAGLWAENTAGTGLATAIVGVSGSPDGEAINGNVTSTTGRNYGVIGQSASDDGRGVLGRAYSEVGAGVGVMGVTKSPGGRGVSGLSQATTGLTYGVYGRTNSSEGIGVYGISDSTPGTTFGVYGMISSVHGSGVYGESAYTTGDGIGVHGVARALGDGVVGEVTYASGDGAGVRGSSSASAGYGGRFTGWKGVYGEGRYGVEGYSSAGPVGRGVYGHASGGGPAYGVYGSASSAEGFGVYGLVTSNTGTTYGVYGWSGSPDGYGGYFGGSGTALYADGNLEVHLPTDCVDTACDRVGALVVSRGTSTTYPTLRVVNESAGTGYGAYLRTDGTGSPLVLAQYGSGDVMWGWVSGRGTVFSVSNEGNVVAAGTVTPNGADLAESFAVEGAIAAYQPGDVLSISTSGSRLLNLSEEPYSSRVAGVYATKPGVLLSDVPHGSSVDRVPLGVVGVIPTKVSAENGPIQPGDLLTTSSTPGHAMRADRAQLTFGAVLGKALEPFEGPGTGLIEVLVNVK